MGQILGCPPAARAAAGGSGSPTSPAPPSRWTRSRRHAVRGVGFPFSVPAQAVGGAGRGRRASGQRAPPTRAGAAWRLCPPRPTMRRLYGAAAADRAQPWKASAAAGGRHVMRRQNHFSTGKRRFRRQNGRERLQKGGGARAAAAWRTPDVSEEKRAACASARGAGGVAVDLTRAEFERAAEKNGRTRAATQPNNRRA